MREKSFAKVHRTIGRHGPSQLPANCDGGVDRMVLSWQRDRNQALRRRAIAEGIEDQQRIAAFEGKRRAVPSKADLRVLAEQAAQAHNFEPRGEWIVACQCGHEAKVKITFSEARNKDLRCSRCDVTQRLSEDDLKPPWE
jgi:hypothetical protein